MARIHRYTKGTVTLSDTLVGTDVENQKATVNIPVAAIVDLAIDYFSVNGNGNGINQSLLNLTTSIDGNTEAIAIYQNIVNTHTSELESIVTRTEKLESVFETNNDGTLTLSTANITNFAETIASEGFASATTVDSLSSQVQQIIDGQLTIDTYATIDQLANTTSTLEGSIATLQDTLTAGYQSYADGIIQTDAFASAVNGLVVQAGADFSSSTQWTNLLSSFGTFDANGNLQTLSSAFANDVLSSYTGPDLATAQSVTDLGAEFGTFDANGNLTGLSTALAGQITTTIAGEGYATSSDLTTLESTLTSYIDSEIASSSTAGITGSQLTTVLADYALAQTVTDLNAQIFDAQGNVIDAFATSLLQTTAGNGVATAQSVTDLTATVNGNTASVNTNQSAIADINGNLTSAYGITVDAGGNIAGMQLLSDSNTGSSISFNSDVFTINVNGTDVAPFIVNANGISLNGAVTFSNASTGQGIDFDDLSTYLTQNNYTTTSDLPDTSAFLDQAALASYLQDNGYVTGNTAGITEVQLLNILSGQNTTVNTVINGSNITTGIIASGDFEMPVNSALSGFSVSGMGINLDNSSIHAEQFYINPDGSANFGGTHSAGSVGNWTVDPSGALKDGSSEIVLDPSGNYTEVGTEKLLLSSENLPAISPSAAVSANFTFSPGTVPNPLSSSGPNYSSYRKTSATGYQSTTFGAKKYKYSYPDLTGTLPGANAQNNISYDSYTGGTFEYVIPYGQGPNTQSQTESSAAFIATMGFQKGFGADYGWGSIFTPINDPFTGEAPDDVGPLDYTAIPNVPGVAGLDYELKVTFRFNFVPDDISNGLVKILHTEEKVLRTGTITKNLRDATPQILTPTSDIEYFGLELVVPGNWASGQIAGSFTPTGADADIGTPSNPGKIAVVATYHYEITNMYIWAAAVPNTRPGEYLLNSTSQPWAYTYFTGRQYLSSGEDLYNSFSNVLFTGAGSKTNIGLNGMQIRGSKGFVAFGDVVPGSDNAVAQIWGNANVFGTITSNASQSFSDKNLKENINPISNALDTVSKLEPVSFSWKPGMRNMDLGTRYGFIAQDIQGVLPTIVKEGDHLTLEHNNIISINTAAIKELVDKINKLEEEIKTLKENNG